MNGIEADGLWVALVAIGIMIITGLIVAFIHRRWTYVGGTGRDGLKWAPCSACRGKGEHWDVRDGGWAGCTSCHGAGGWWR